MRNKCCPSPCLRARDHIKNDPREAGEFRDLATGLIRHNDCLVAKPSSLFRISGQVYSFLNATIGSTCIALRAGM